VTTANLLKAPLLVALLLPGLVAGLCAWSWWSSLSRPWLFLLLSLVSLYALSAYLMLRQFGQIGISGQPSANAAETFGAFLIREGASALIVFFVASGAILWLLRWLLSSSRT
jgi:hypothetical protein